MIAKRVLTWGPALALLVLIPGLWGVRAAQPKKSPSALEADPTGWVDLLAGGDLHPWQRVSIPPGSKLSSKDPWSLDPRTKILACDGVGLHEMLLYKQEMSDGILHVEWRFHPVEGKKGYNSGVFVRTSEDGKVWHQAQVGAQNIGYLFGDTLVNGQLQRVKIPAIGPQRGREVGEWNTYEVTCKGPDLTLWINGAVTCRWNHCAVPRGHVGLEAEGYRIDFRNVKYKALP